VAKKNLMNYYSEKKKRFDENLNTKEAKLNSLQNYINNFENTITKVC
jgi:glucan phosphoethanolaminetransferase (alkaline phosphatase superfamily)